MCTSWLRYQASFLSKLIVCKDRIEGNEGGYQAADELQKGESIMTLDTQVFRRIITEHREAAVNAIDETMVETVRFGTFNPEYRRGCAADRFEDNLKRVQNPSI